MLNAMHPFDSPFGVLHLERYPPDPAGRLRAYDGADRLLLDEFARLRSEGSATGGARVLVIGDQHGALTTALAGAAVVTSYGDSELSARAAERNLHAAGRQASVNRGLPTDAAYDAVLMRVPKSLELFAAQLAALSGRLAAGTPVVAGGMTKHLSRGANEVLAKYIGDVTPSLGRFKARLLRASADPTRRAAAPEPTEYTVNEPSVTLTNVPGTFGSGQLDLGARTLLPHLPTGLGDVPVADLGCGNGVLGICSALANPAASYTLIDESAQALKSARRSWDGNLPGREVRIVLGDGLADEPPASYDVVLCNPPFHVGFAIDPGYAHRMLEQARRALRPGGELYAVGNRHLDHGAFLRRRFDRVDELAATPKFTVHRARV